MDILACGKRCKDRANYIYDLLSDEEFDLMEKHIEAVGEDAWEKWKTKYADVISRSVFILSGHHHQSYWKIPHLRRKIIFAAAQRASDGYAFWQCLAEVFNARLNEGDFVNKSAEAMALFTRSEMDEKTKQS